MNWPARIHEARAAVDAAGGDKLQAARALSAAWGCRVSVDSLTSALRRWADVPHGYAPQPMPQIRNCDPVAETVTERPVAEKLVTSDADESILRERNRQLLSEVTRLRKAALTEESVRRELLRLSDAPRSVPDWLVRPSSTPGLYGVPCAFMSDQHLGEVVSADQMDGVNRYDLAIARTRWRRFTERTIEILHRYLVKPRFDGLVFALGGDGASGDIHDELSATNETEIGPVVLELADLIVWSVREFKRAFGRVFVPATFGNHPRMSDKPRHKGAAFTNFDWLAAQIAAREFRDDPNVRVLIPSGPDVRFNIYSHRYCLTHGNQFRGGDGIIGPIGPVFRGDSKKRARNAQVGASYDTLLIGHFHQLRMDSRVIMNGSLKGYDEFASDNNFPFEPPKQALWLTHPERGITFSFPVFVEDPPQEKRRSEWASAA